MADDIDVWIVAEFERLREMACGPNDRLWNHNYPRALTLLQQTRAALRTRLSEHATEQGRSCECKMCVADRKLLAGEV